MNYLAIFYYSLSWNDIFYWSIDQLTSQSIQLIGQLSVRSKLPSPHPSRTYIKILL